MRIISPFKDYYDIGMQYGYDPKLQWIRRTSDIELENRRLASEFIILHFCGKIYRGLVVKQTYNSREIIWDNDTYASYCAENNIKPIETRWFDQFWITSRNVKANSRVTVLGQIKESDVLNDKYSSPIILENNKGFIVNPSLKDIQFYKVFDPVTTYQKISEYFGNKFFNEPPPPIKLTDKEKVLTHGFDKSSFRKTK